MLLVGVVEVLLTGVTSAGAVVLEPTVVPDVGPEGALVTLGAVVPEVGPDGVVIGLVVVLVVAFTALEFVELLIPENCGDD